VKPCFSHHLHPGELLLAPEPSVAVGSRSDHLLPGEQVVRLPHLPLADQLHHPVRYRWHHIGRQDDPSPGTLRVEGDDPVHASGSLERLGDGVGPVVLDGEAES
jgi:hypothetical protein